MTQANVDNLKKQAEELEKQILKDKKRLTELRKQIPDEEVRDYTFKSVDGTTTNLSELFGEKTDLIVIHNMGEKCPYCTLWADGFNGVVHHLENRASFVVISPDEPQVQKEFAASRGWRFKMLSGHENSFAKDMGYNPKEGDYWPGVSAFYKTENGKIYRSGTAILGPGDDFCNVWHLFDLLKDGVNKWNPKYKY
ncbi:MAG: DUF899 family protein [bacterium]